MAPSDAVTKALEKAARRAAQAAAADAAGTSPETSELSKAKGLEKKLEDAKEKSRQVYMDTHLWSFDCHSSSIKNTHFKLAKLPTTINGPVTPFGWQAAI